MVMWVKVSLGTRGKEKGEELRESITLGNRGLGLGPLN